MFYSILKARFIECVTDIEIFDNMGPFRTLKKGRRLIGLDEYPKINFTNMTTTISFELPTSPSTISVTTIRKFFQGPYINYFSQVTT